MFDDNKGNLNNTPVYSKNASLEIKREVEILFDRFISVTSVKGIKYV